MKILFALLILLIPLGALAQNASSPQAPAIFPAGDPGACVKGTWWFDSNTTPGVFRGCTSTNIPTNLGVGTPAGTNGQIQINSSGVFGAITPGGDVSLSGSNFTVNSTGGAAFAASATTDTTVATNITTGTLPAARLPNPSASTLGGIESFAAVSNQWIRSISTAGVPSSSQPNFTDLAGSIAVGQSQLTTSQDIWYRNAAGALDRFGVGTNGQCLGVNSSLLAWIACGSGGNTAWQANGSLVVTSGTFNAVPGFGMSAPLTNVGGVATFTPAVNTAVILSNANAEAGKTIYCASTTGTGSAATCSLSAAAALTVYTVGQPFLLNVDTTCATSCTLNIDSVGLKSIKKKDGTTDPGGVLVAGQAQFVWYDGTVFRLVNN